MSLPGIDPDPARIGQDPCNTAATEGLITIDCLGLSFRVPTSFRVTDDPDLLFVAKSDSPRAVISIDRDEPSVIAYEPEGQESAEAVKIDGVDTVIVTDAFLQGLAPELEARELLVANGDRSFSLIMSSLEAELPSLWRGLIASIQIEPE